MKKKSGAKCATKCAVKHCPNKYICSDKLSYFKLPKDAERYYNNLNFLTLYLIYKIFLDVKFGLKIASLV